MSEAWRRKTYYDPRVLLETAEFLDPLFSDCLICLSGSELYALRNLTQYLHRRSTFVSSYHQGYYLAPTNEEWDDIEAIVAELEGKLMNCQQYDDLLQSILEAAECACNRAVGNPGLNYNPNNTDETTSFDISDTIPDAALGAEEEEACDVAQLWYQWGYEVITEYILPATRFTFDFLLPGLAAFIIGATGGAPAILGLWTIAELVQKLMEGAYDAAETNLVNWLESNKEDLVCGLYNGILGTGQASTIWSYVYDTRVADAEDISSLDKLMVNLAMGSWAGVNAQAAYDAATGWATSVPLENYCVSCPEEPIQGDGWFAIPLNQAEFYVKRDPPTGESFRCFPLLNNPGATWCGLVFLAEGESGYTFWSLANATSAGCSNTQYNAWLSHAWNYTMGKYLAINGANVDEAEIAAYFGATLYESSNIYRRTDHIEMAWYLKAYTGKPPQEVTGLYAIFEGEIP